jgi:hypothetical protein
MAEIDLALDKGGTHEQRTALLRRQLTAIHTAADYAMRELDAIPAPAWGAAQRAGFVALARRAAMLLNRTLYEGGECRICSGTARKHYEGCEAAILLADLAEATRND